MAPTSSSATSASRRCPRPTKAAGSPLRPAFFPCVIRRAWWGFVLRLPAETRCAEVWYRQYPAKVYFSAPNPNTTRRQRMFKQRSGPPSVPEVGIFWFIQRPGSPPTLLGSGWRLRTGSHTATTSTIQANTHDIGLTSCGTCHRSSMTASVRIGRGAASSTTPNAAFRRLPQ
jgi:hypothetical protein